MYKAFVVARSEYVTAVASKAFILGVIMMPILMRLSEEFDGMPGQRRKWLRAQIK